MSESLSLKQSLDNNIYKIKHLENGTLHSVYVFNAKSTGESDEQLFKQIFSDKEAEQINSNKVKVVFSSQQIHADDSIGTIKIKIVNDGLGEIK